MAEGYDKNATELERAEAATLGVRLFQFSSIQGWWVVTNLAGKGLCKKTHNTPREALDEYIDATKTILR